MITTLDPNKIVFGKECTPNFLLCKYRDGSWHEPQIVPVENLSLHPAALVLHYAQAIFEGLKAFKQENGQVALFRPELNARRFIFSAKRMDIPPVSEEIFLKGVMELVKSESRWIPAAPGSLYLRPTIIATEPYIGVRTSAEYYFFILALPSGAYFPEVVGGLGAIDVLLSQSVVRAAHGGTGNVKAAANYAITLQSISNAKKLGCAQVLYFNTSPERRVEEMGGMNIFFVEKGELVTPPLSDTILAGITRDSILTIAKEFKLSVREYAYSYQELLEKIKSGEISEAFACGTAAVIAGIKNFKLESGEIIPVGKQSPGELTAKLFHRLQNIQYGKESENYGWVKRLSE
jgi:branched-chain amino acid aminotransferase